MNARVEELFHEVVGLTPADRARYFGEHQVDNETSHEVEALLAFDGGARSFLERDVSIAASRALPQLEGKGWRFRSGAENVVGNAQTAMRKKVASVLAVERLLFPDVRQGGLQASYTAPYDV